MTMRYSHLTPNHLQDALTINPLNSFDTFSTLQAKNRKSPENVWHNQGFIVVCWWSRGDLNPLICRHVTAYVLPIQSVTCFAAALLGLIRPDAGQIMGKLGGHVLCSASYCIAAFAALGKVGFCAFSAIAVSQTAVVLVFTN